MPPVQQAFHWAVVQEGCVRKVDLLLVLHCYARQSAVFSQTLLKHVLPLEGIRILSVIIHPTNHRNEKQDCIIYSMSVRDIKGGGVEEERGERNKNKRGGKVS